MSECEDRVSESSDSDDDFEEDEIAHQPIPKRKTSHRTRLSAASTRTRTGSSEGSKRRNVDI